MPTASDPVTPAPPPSLQVPSRSTVAWLQMMLIGPLYRLFASQARARFRRAALASEWSFQGRLSLPALVLRPVLAGGTMGGGGDASAALEALICLSSSTTGSSNDLNISCTVPNGSESETDKPGKFCCDTKLPRVGDGDALPQDLKLTSEGGETRSVTYSNL
jgi:hypothetical protein